MRTRVYQLPVPEIIDNRTVVLIDSPEFCQMMALPIVSFLNAEEAPDALQAAAMVYDRPSPPRGCLCAVAGFRDTVVSNTTVHGTGGPAMMHATETIWQQFANYNALVLVQAPGATANIFEYIGGTGGTIMSIGPDGEIIAPASTSSYPSIVIPPGKAPLDPPPGSLYVVGCSLWFDCGTGPVNLSEPAAAPLVIGSTPVSGGVNGDVLVQMAGVLVGLGTSGTGNVVLTTSPTLTTPVLGAASATSVQVGTATTFTVAGSTVSPQITDNNNTTAITLNASYSSTAANGAITYGARSRGTIASPTIVAAPDIIKIDYAVAYDGSDFETAGYCQWSVIGTPSATSMGGLYKIAITPDGSTTPTVNLSLNATQIGFLGAAPVSAQTGDVGDALVALGLMTGDPTLDAADLTGTLDPSVLPAATSVAFGGTITPTNIPTWFEIPFTFADLNGVGAVGSHTYALFTLAAGSFIHAQTAFCNLTISFSGGTIGSLVASAGYSGASTYILSSFALHLAGSPTDPQASNPFPANSVVFPFSSTTAFTMAVTAGGDTLNHLTAGAAKIYLLVSKP